MQSMRDVELTCHHCGERSCFTMDELAEMMIAKAQRVVAMRVADRDEAMSDMKRLDAAVSEAKSALHSVETFAAKFREATP